MSIAISIVIVIAVYIYTHIPYCGGDHYIPSPNSGAEKHLQSQNHNTGCAQQHVDQALAAFEAGHSFSCVL